MLPKDDLVHVVDRTALIENLLNQIIERYCSPRKEAFDFFWQVVLDSSIMSLGAKVKVAMAVSQRVGVKLKSDPLHKLLSYRNAFAHHALDAHSVVLAKKNPEQDELHYYLHVISNSGKIQEIRRDEAVKDFDMYHALARTSLLELRDAVCEEVNDDSKGGESNK